jgi:hypothetical protein
VGLSWDMASEGCDWDRGGGTKVAVGPGPHGKRMRARNYEFFFCHLEYECRT